MTSDCICLLDSEEKADLEEDRGATCELLAEYEESTKDQ